MVQTFVERRLTDRADIPEIEEVQWLLILGKEKDNVVVSGLSSQLLGLRL